MSKKAHSRGPRPPRATIHLKAHKQQQNSVQVKTMNRVHQPHGEHLGALACTIQKASLPNSRTNMREVLVGSRSHPESHTIPWDVRKRIFPHPRTDSSASACRMAWG